MLLVGFDEDFSRMTIRDCCDVALIERGTDRVSPADGHPGVRGNQDDRAADACRWCRRASAFEGYYAVISYSDLLRLNGASAAVPASI